MNSGPLAASVYPERMDRQVGLKGHSFDLQDLADAFGSGDPQIVQEDGDYFLVASEFASFGDDHVGLLNRAREILAQMDGAVLLINGQHRPVEVTGSIRDQGGRHHAVIAADSIEGRSRVSAVLISVGDTAQRPSVSPARTAVDAASTSKSASAILRLLGQRQLDWVNLYRILDYVAHECGGKKAMVSAGLATDDEIDRFGAAANRIEISGDEARHGPMKGAPPTRTMALEEGRAFIRRLVNDWLASI